MESILEILLFRCTLYNININLKYNTKANICNDNFLPKLVKMFGQIKFRILNSIFASIHFAQSDEEIQKKNSFESINFSLCSFHGRNIYNRSQ